MRKLSNFLNIVTLRIVYFAYFQSLVNYGIIFWGSSSTMHNVFLMQNRIIRIVLGLGPRSSCRGVFRKLDVLTVPSLYIYALMMSVVNNPDSFQSNSTIHCIMTRQNNQLHLPTITFSSIQKGVIYVSIKILTTKFIETLYSSTSLYGASLMGCFSIIFIFLFLVLALLLRR